MQTFLEFKTKIKRRLFPSGEPLSLVASHDASFQQVMLDLQKWVPCLKQYNISTWATADRSWENAKSVVTAPFGQIRRVYAVAGGLDRWRDKVFYRSSNFQDIECWARTLYAAKTPVNAGQTDLGFGFKNEEAAADSLVGRARVGAWAVHRHRLYIAPWLQSTELLVVEWDGEKVSWSDSDGVDETYWRQDAELAVQLYVASRHEQFYGNPAIAPGLMQEYHNVRADLMYWCRENTRQQENVICDSGSGGPGLGGLNSSGGDITSDDDDPTTDTTDADTVLFDAVGDVGDVNADASAVAVAVISDHPEAFLALGDLSYNSDYPGDFGAKYSSLMTVGKLIPLPGNHDWDIDGTLSAYKTYFADFIGSNGHNYEATVGPIHFLIYDSDARFADGINAASAQAEWLRVKLLLSTARWKIVLMHRPPFSSDTTHGSEPDLQLAFKAWGADLVIAGHGHDYERLEVGGLPYINVGTGGRALYVFGAPVAGSLVRIAGIFGRLIGQADCDQLVLTFKSVADVVLDTLTITKT